ncbi:hypothetical protein KsCSTR_04070 [Candidatus Kuenenia stuttgartiensis]|uniref:Uncharacterized protein n=1 Tax=Kuenenia stuttgartiensis TaxID=174633 RepID=A0A6G7GJQ9_KUEST|nr:hypothetical protein KsCSTR_04070 [Candidatus Kuenenia stuttgartiensis]
MLPICEPVMYKIPQVPSKKRGYKGCVLIRMQRCTAVRLYSKIMFRGY